MSIVAGISPHSFPALLYQSPAVHHLGQEDQAGLHLLHLLSSQFGEK